jgi:hypothetical protein
MPSSSTLFDPLNPPHTQDFGGFSTDQLDASFKKFVAMGIHRLAENVTVDFDAHDIPGFARQLGASLS